MDIEVFNFHAHEEIIVQMWNVAVTYFKVSYEMICRRTLEDFGEFMKLISVNIFTCDV